MSQIIHVPPSADGGHPEALLIDASKPTKALPVDVTIFPLSNFVAFPHMILPVVVPKGKLQDLLHKTNSNLEYIGFVARKRGQGEDPSPTDLYEFGVCARILRVLRLPEGSTSIIIQTLKRFKVESYTASVPVIKAHVLYLEDSHQNEKKIQALTTSAQTLLQELIQLSPTLSEEFSLTALNIEGPTKLSDFIAAHLKRIDLPTRQSLLETMNLEERLEKCIFHLTQELEILRLGQKIQGEIQNKITSSQREYFLREQLKAIKKELGEEKEDHSQDIKKLKEKLEAAKLSEEAKSKADEEMKRLSMMAPESTEYSITRNYIDWLASLPWSTTTEDINDVRLAEKILQKDHFGLKDVKTRILEFLSVKNLRKDLSGSIICFVGPPGVGKTSLGKSIAEALGRKFFRLSLGGMRDEAEIKGHRRTYVGSMPGRIIQALKRSGAKNPVFVLDEIDKIGTDWRGDPASALLEVLDPEQNKNFLDHYLDVGFDLSKIMFICTANMMDTIPHALRDRMEVIEISGYIESEKVAIASKYLFPKQLKESGLEPKHLKISPAAMLDIVRFYTREAGVRNLEREIEKLCRKVAHKISTKIQSKEKIEAVLVTPKNLSTFLGVHKFSNDSIIPRKPGVVMGLAWTSVGGEVLFIEASKMPGSKNLQLTGKLGETMSESAKIALSYVRSAEKKYGFDLSQFDKTDIHIHFPAGAIRKDGPSAGITVATALVSLFKNQPIKKNVAMTGEISLVGQVLPIGGLKQKLIAAKQFKCKEVIIPFENKKDLTELPKEVKSGLKFHFAKTYDDVYRVVFGALQKK
ncbi:MAG: endopeptidase La [Deltaproteobacteria bacterium]|nr:endopeptidase La [Deltaproteobacteria bacterium]